MDAADRPPVADRQLERQGRKLGHTGVWWLTVGLVIAIPGIVLIAIGTAIGLGIAIVLIASGPVGIGLALLVSSAISRWSARHRLFA